MSAFQRVVATLAVVGLLAAAGVDCIHHAAHAGHHEAEITMETKASHITILNHDASRHSHDETSHTFEVDPPSPPEHGDDTGDCTHCGAAHCFACVMPTNVSISAPWLIAKKGFALDSFAAPHPTWRLERPPKNAL